MPFRVVSAVGPRNHVLEVRGHLRHLANTFERLCAAATSESATRGGDAVCSQITLSNLVIAIARETKYIFMLEMCGKA